MLVIEKKENIKSKEEFIKTNCKNNILIINRQVNTFGYMKNIIDACNTIDKWLIVEIGSDYFYISKYNPANKTGSQNFLSDRSYLDIIKENFNA